MSLQGYLRVSEAMIKVLFFLSSEALITANATYLKPVEIIRDKIILLLIRTGYISEYEEEIITPQDPFLEEEPVYAESMSASVKYMIAFLPM